MGNAVTETRDERLRGRAGGDDVTEIHHHADGRPGQLVGEQLCPLQRMAQPEQVQRFDPERQVLLGGALRCPGQSVGNPMDVRLQVGDRVVIDRAVRQYQRLRADGGGQVQQSIEMLAELRTLLTVKDRVEITDVTVHRPHGQSG